MLSVTVSLHLVRTDILLEFDVLGLATHIVYILSIFGALRYLTMEIQKYNIGTMAIQEVH